MALLAQPILEQQFIAWRNCSNDGRYAINVVSEHDRQAVREPVEFGITRPVLPVERDQFTVKAAAYDFELLDGPGFVLDGQGFGRRLYLD
jgi:hypothetical protein